MHTKFAVVSLHSLQYEPLSNITWPGKQAYCDKHGYLAINKFSPFTSYGDVVFDKVEQVRLILEEHPEIEWLLFVSCDSVITNQEIKIEDRIDDAYDIVIATDYNGMNTDSYLVKNSEWSRTFLKRIMDMKSTYMCHIWFDQSAFIEELKNFEGRHKIVPQKLLNSYEPGLGPDPAYSILTDKLGTPSSWEKGDWIIQFPGVGLDVKIATARKYVA